MTSFRSSLGAFAGALTLTAMLVFGAMFTAYSCTYQTASADTAYRVNVTELAARKPVQLAQADTAPADAGVASTPDTSKPAPAASSTTPAPTMSPLDELTELRLKYEALRAAKPDVKMLAWAALIAAALKLLLSLFNRYVFKETKTWTKWVALGAAIPIALLSYYALGNGLFASLVYAGAGPGAIIVHELLQKKAPSSS